MKVLLWKESCCQKIVTFFQSYRDACWARRKSNEKKKTNRSVGTKLPMRPLSKGRDDPRESLSNQPGLMAIADHHCDLSTGSLPAIPVVSLRWGERKKKGRGPKGPDRHARPCKVRAYLCGRLPFPPVQSFFFWLGSRSPELCDDQAYDRPSVRVGTMTWDSVSDLNRVPQLN